MIKLGSIFAVCLILPIIIVSMMGCTTKGLDYEAGLVKFEAGQLDEAIAVFSEIAKTPGKYQNRAKFYIGECYKLQFKWDEATAQFQQVSDTEPAISYLGSEARNRISQIRNASKDIERLKFIHDNNPGTTEAADAFLELGSVYENNLDDYQNAIKIYRQLIQEFPGSQKAVQAQVNIGNIYFYKLYDIDKGWSEFLNINEQNYPDLKFRVAEVKKLLIETNKIRSEINEHIAFISQSQKRKIPEHGSKTTGYEIYGVKEDQVAQSFLAVGKKWRDLKNYPKAIEAYRILIERLSLRVREVAQARFGIAEIYQYDLGRYFEAVDAYEDYIKYHPTDFRREEAVYNLAICYESLRDYESAYNYYKAYRDSYSDGKFFKAAEMKVRQYEYDEDQDGFPYYKEAAAGTSDTDPAKHP